MSVTNNVGAHDPGRQRLRHQHRRLQRTWANELATVVNHGLITGDGVTGDGDGVDVDGLVNVTNTGTIRSLNAFSSVHDPASEGLSVGGGTITNSGTIQGSVAAGNLTAVGRGITLTGNDITTGPNAGKREPIYGDAIVTNQAGGLIHGDNDSGIAVDRLPGVRSTVTINNQAGAAIRGGGDDGARRSTPATASTPSRSPTPEPSTARAAARRSSWAPATTRSRSPAARLPFSAISTAASAA